MNKPHDYLVIVSLQKQHRDGLYKNGTLVAVEDSITLSDVFEWFGDGPFFLTRAWSDADFVVFPDPLDEFAGTFTTTQGHFLPDYFFEGHTENV